MCLRGSICFTGLNQDCGFIVGIAVNLYIIVYFRKIASLQLNFFIIKKNLSPHYLFDINPQLQTISKSETVILPVSFRNEYKMS